MKDATYYSNLLKEHLCKSYKDLFREPGGVFEFPYVSPSSSCYSNQLWDWDSWISDLALMQIVANVSGKDAFDEAIAYGKGCVQNFLLIGQIDGWLPIVVRQFDHNDPKPDNIYETNMHKPVLAQHAAFITKLCGGDAEWIRERFFILQAFINNYRNHHMHRSGVYYWQDDHAIGVDNDPCTYFRPPKSSGSIYLNCLMYKEYEALIYLCECQNLNEIADDYRKDKDDLYKAIMENCWDERDGFFYSVDLNLLPNENVTGTFHPNMPRDWDSLIQRIGVWSGFMALWAKIATPEQAKRIVEEHYRNEKTFHAPFGVRTLSKMEKMYNVKATGNPSNWLGPIWGICNYMTFKGLVHYGYNDDAKELAEKTILLFGRDVERFGAMHEYYLPESGEPVLNRGFQDWNYLVMNMICWLEGNEPVSEF